MNYYVNRKTGSFWLRTRFVAFRVKAPWNLPLFSERYGYDKPILSAFGWRVFKLKRVG